MSMRIAWRRRNSHSHGSNGSSTNILSKKRVSERERGRMMIMALRRKKRTPRCFLRVMRKSPSSVR